MSHDCFSELILPQNELLVDTCGLIKWMDGTLPESAKTHLLGAERRYFSVVSAWEIRLKPALRVLTPADVDDAVRKMGLEVQPLLLSHVARVADVQRFHPLPHNDPFDHLLVAQALVYGWPILTCDRKMAEYPGIEVVW